MATRKDLLKAHKFTGSRLVAALVDRDPDRIDSPLRRIGMGTFASIMIGIVILAGFGVVGLLRPGQNSTWKDEENLVVIDSEAGQVFWYKRPILYPMENITSALLASNGAAIQVLKSASLQDAERGQRLGIAGAPGQLPKATDLGFFPTQVCATAPEARTQARHTTLSAGEFAKPAGTDTPVVFVDASGNHFLVVAGTAHLVPKPPGTDTPALLVQLSYPVVRDAFGLLSTIPLGTVLSQDRILAGIDDLGGLTSSPAGPAQRIGDLVKVQGSDVSYLMLANGLASITPLELETLRAEGREVFELSANEVSSHLAPPDQRDRGSSDLPPTLPAVPSAPGLGSMSVCATWANASAAPVLAFGVETPPVAAPAPDPRLAAVVHMRPGKGALLENESAISGNQAAVLIAEGKRYGVPDVESLGALGYGAAPRDKTRAEILALIPPGLPGGTALSIALAGQPPAR